MEKYQWYDIVISELSDALDSDRGFITTCTANDVAKILGDYRRLLHYLI